ncbi:MAG: PucR family transcriptional regulator ligand-binding domain-containing protein [Sporolactobacillus sp.]
MYYTVERVLSHPILKDAQLLAGQDHLEKKQIESVSVIELPVEQFVKKNEFVLTTGIGCDKNPDIFKTFVQEIYESKASALAVAVGRYLPEIPDDVIDFSMNHHFPLIQLPWEIPFSDIIHLVIEGIHKWEQTILIQSDRLQKEIISLYLNNQTLSDALNCIEAFFQRTVSILLQGHIIRSSHYSDAAHPEIPAYLNTVDLAHPSIIQTGLNSFAQVFPFQIFNADKGALIVESQSKLEPIIPESVLDQLITSMQLWFKKEQVTLERKCKGQRRFLTQLINENWENIRSEALQSGLIAEGTYLSIVGGIEEDNDSSVSESISYKLEELIKNLIHQYYSKSFCSIYSDSIVIFLGTNSLTAQSAAELIASIETALKENGYPITISWGINLHAMDISLLGKSYDNAHVAMKTGRNQNGPGTRYIFEDNHIFQLLSILTQEDSVSDIIKQVIFPLLQYNKERGLDLFHTLTKYINCQGNVSQTARELSLQRQSLIYRLQKIESLTHKSLSNSNDLFLLQLCIKIWTMTNGRLI